MVEIEIGVLQRQCLGRGERLAPGSGVAGSAIGSFGQILPFRDECGSGWLRVRTLDCFDRGGPEEKACGRDRDDNTERRAGPPAVANGYDDLVMILRARADELGLSRLVIDELARVAPGYSSKVLSLCGAKKLGPASLLKLVKGLGMKLERTARIIEDAARRDASPPATARYLNPRAAGLAKVKRKKKKKKWLDWGDPVC